MPFTTTVAARLANLIECNGNGARTAEIEAFAADHLPHGSGIDNGTAVDLEASTPTKLVLIVPFHTMDPNGYYAGWRDYRVTVTPCFDGIRVRITGRDYNGLKDYLGDLFHHALGEPVTVGIRPAPDTLTAGAGEPGQRILVNASN